MADLLNPDDLRKKVTDNLRYHTPRLAFFGKSALEEALQHDDLESGIFFHSKSLLNIDTIVERYIAYGDVMRDLIDDTEELLRDLISKANRVLFEGAQGLALDIDHGSYPYVTSSNASAHGIARGAGLTIDAVERVLGLVKAYGTRVGEGAFPTELGGGHSDRWCNDRLANRNAEHERYADASLDSTDEFLQGVALRRAGDEYGTTTGRPRRVGWIDLPLLRWACSINGPEIGITKLDVLDQSQYVKMCTSYTYVGPPYSMGRRTLKRGDELHTAILHNDVLRHCRPNYLTLEGWQVTTSQVRSFADLPPACQKFLRTIEIESGATIRLISVGPDREQTILVS